MGRKTRTTQVDFFNPQPISIVGREGQWLRFVVSNELLWFGVERGEERTKVLRV